ncbi:MAG TPA: AgmX/PglI C-terminal domain-containing protein [Polyangiaceae bacterium]
MRVARSFYALPILSVLGLGACGGSPPPAANAPTAPAESAPAPTDSAAPTSSKAPEEDGWAGENAAKNGDTKPAAAASAAAAPAPSDGKGVETRTMDVIRQAVMDNRKAARKCYEDARKDLKDLKGDVTIHFVIDPEGNVKSAELNQERSTLKSPAVVNCVIGVIKGIKFPRSSRAMETSTNYPFNFTP